MDLAEMSYTREVAHDMLQIQQAQAQVDARKLIVEGAVDLVRESLDQLAEKGIELEKDQEVDLVKRMMVVTCSD